MLVVEDDALIRIDISSSLTDEGYEVLEAANADEAIEILESTADIRLIFTDIDMPGSMDGLKLAAAVARRWPPIRIIVTSGKNTAETAQMPERSVFFSKPYQPATVIETMSKMLSGQH